MEAFQQEKCRKVGLVLLKITPKPAVIPGRNALMKSGEGGCQGIMFVVKPDSPVFIDSLPVPHTGDLT